MADHLGETLYRLRTERGLSQQQLANRLHVTRSAVANWESGHRQPSVATVFQLARVLNVDAAAMLTAADNPDEPPCILLVDDNPIALEGGVAIVQEALPNAKVVGFSSPKQAVEYVESNSVAVVFLDIELGRTSGLNLCQELLRINPGVNVVYLTAYRDYAYDAWNTGASGFLLKPLAPEEVRKVIPMLRHPVRGLL